MFGTFLIKEGRKELKRYRALFTCLSSRAVHIECTFSPETDSFIQALHCFVAQRGTCVSARAILMSLLHTHGRSLNNDSLRTLLVETEAIVNSRSLTADTLGDVQSEQPICPCNILTIKSKVVLPPPGHFMKADEYSRKRWRRIQHIANDFWVRWQKEFLWSLQPRHKWNKKQRHFQNGDIVLLKRDAKLNQWPMANVVGINSDAEAFVRIVKLLIRKTRNDGD